MRARDLRIGMNAPPTALDHEQLIGEALEAYSQSWRALRQYAEPVWTQLELTISQLKGLLLLDVRGSMTIGQLAGILEIGRPSASILIEQLVQFDLVDRKEDAADRRRTLVGLTVRGKDLVARLYQGDQEYMRTWFERLRNEDLEALSQGLRALAAAATPAGSVLDDEAMTLNARTFSSRLR